MSFKPLCLMPHGTAGICTLHLALNLMGFHVGPYASPMEFLWERMYVPPKT